MRRISIDHQTDYGFGTPVDLLPHQLMLRPRESPRVRIISSEFDIQPRHSIRWRRDVLDNAIALVTFAESSDRLHINSKVVIEHYLDTPLDFVVEDHAYRYPFEYAADEASLLAPFRMALWPEDRWVLQDWLGRVLVARDALETFTLLDRLNRAIHQRFRQENREAPGVQSPAETLALGAGSCRDLAALFIELTRHLGLASRFVSGYVQSALSEAGQGSTHAWIEVYLPGPGWTGFDPTEGELTGSRHIAVAVASHPSAVPPVSGAYVGRPNQPPWMRVAVRVREQAERDSATFASVCTSIRSIVSLEPSHGKL